MNFDRHYAGPRPHVVGGRIIILGPRGLSAVDVYTGRLLWQKTSTEIAGVAKPYTPAGGYNWDLVGSSVLGSQYVSLADGIYVASGRICVRLDPETGEKVAEIHLPSDDKPDSYRFGPIRIWKNILVAMVEPIGTPLEKISKRNLQRRDGWTWVASREIVAFDRNSGEKLWSLKAKQGYRHNAVAIGNGKVYGIDRWGADPKTPPVDGTLFALDAQTGKEVWSTTENVFGAWLSYSKEANAVLQGGYRGRNSNDSRAIAYDDGSGKLLWDSKAGGGPWMLNGKILISQRRRTMDIRTGKALKSYKYTNAKSCDYEIGGRHIIANREFSIAYIDLDTGTRYSVGGVRSGCINALIQADGVFSIPYAGTGCACALNFRCSMTLIHMPELTNLMAGSAGSED